jgi:1,4-dihydroxy-2-naphthoate octaprenyltransferase
LRWHGLAAVAALLRYRFFLWAGALPYVLGAAVAHHDAGVLDWRLLGVGLLGVFGASLGVEGMNEYFDSKIGGDRVFASVRRVAVWWHLPLGLLGFGSALLAGLWLAAVRGWPVLCFAGLGGAAALAYLMPPVQLSYRGFGELTIALTYGPALTLGSFYLQTGRLSWSCLGASALSGMVMLALALANEVPDYRGDSLVGKRNLVVRAGPRGGVRLYGIALALCLALLVGGVVGGWLPVAAWLALLLTPVGVGSVQLAARHCETPTRFKPVLRRSMLLYVSVNVIVILSFLTE